MNPLDQYSSIQPLVKLDIDNAISQYATERQYDVAKIPTHTHTGKDANFVNFADVENRTRYVLYRILSPTTNCAVATSVGGDFNMPFGGYMLELGATVDTAGTTSTMTVNVLKNAVTVLLGDIYINSAEKTSRTATIPVILDSSKVNFVIGDIFTFNIDTIHTTAALGLTIFMKVVDNTP